jgi:hypothetical protein
VPDVDPDTDRVLKQSRFAGAVGADDAESSSCFYFETDVTESPEFPVRLPAAESRHFFETIGRPLVDTILF